jgi:hypothetical protein
MGDVIASYSERRFDGTRLFELYRDCVAISGGHSLGPRREQKVPLEALSPDPERIWVRPDGFRGGILMMIVFAVPPLVFGSVLSLNLKGLLWGLAGAGALLALATERRVEWANYRNTGGTTVLSIARSENGFAEFQKFLEAINDAVREAKSGHGA